MKIFRHQGKHLLALLALMIPVVWFAQQPGLLEGAWLGISTRAWYWIAIAIPVVHQFGVMILWRLELYEKSMSRLLGERAFAVFQLFFFPGLVARPISVITLGWADRGSCTAPVWILYTTAALMTPVLLYLLYSVVHFFGVQRAAGADHFLEEYRSKPLVKEGIYRYLPNSMYVVGFFAIWIPALVLASRAALVVSVFQHLLIWAHYFFTEKPDMRVIYGETVDG